MGSGARKPTALPFDVADEEGDCYNVEEEFKIERILAVKIKVHM